MIVGDDSLSKLVMSGVSSVASSVTPLLRDVSDSEARTYSSLRKVLVSGRQAISWHYETSVKILTRDHLIILM